MRCYYFIFLLSWFLFDCQKKYSTESINLSFKSSPEKIEKGKQLAMAVCGPCHYNPTSGSLSGKQMLDVPCSIGKVYASNITNDSVAGAGGYSPGQIKYLLKTGISKDGKFAPYMLKPNMSQEDIENIVAFLKSEDPLVRPSRLNPGKTKYSALGKFALAKVFHPVEYSSQEKKRPSAYDTVQLGKYLVDVTGCYECHSANMIKTNRIEPEKSKGYLGGGAKIKRADGKLIRTPNLTFDQTGLKDWTLHDFEKALKDGVGREYRVLSYPMPNYATLSSDEIESIYKYLKSVKPIRNSISKKKSPITQQLDGQSLFEKYSCTSCHGKTGKGIADLNNAYLKYDFEGIRNRIEAPPSSTGMPPFKNIIKEEEFPVLIEYIVQLGKNSKKS
jgi:mono/diheme cytochrome c family protein